jgi:hypothetical protein
LPPKNQKRQQFHRYYSVLLPRPLKGIQPRQQSSIDGLSSGQQHQQQHSHHHDHTTMSVNPEPLVSYTIPSYNINQRLNMEPIFDPTHLQHPSDEPPLVRSQYAPAVLTKMRISIPQPILHSMADIEITPGHQQLRGTSLAITSHMSSGWLGATFRAREYKRTKTRHKHHRRNSLSLDHHCNYSNTTNQPSHDSHAASISRFRQLKDPQNLLPSSPIRDAKEKTITFVDDIPQIPGAWGNAKHKSFEAFQEKTKLLISGSYKCHGSVLNRVAVF